MLAKIISQSGEMPCREVKMLSATLLPNALRGHTAREAAAARAEHFATMIPHARTHARTQGRQAASPRSAPVSRAGHAKIGPADDRVRTYHAPVRTHRLCRALFAVRKQVAAKRRAEQAAARLQGQHHMKRL